MEQVSRRRFLGTVGFAGAYLGTLAFGKGSAGAQGLADPMLAGRPLVRWMTAGMASAGSDSHATRSCSQPSRNSTSLKTP